LFEGALRSVASAAVWHDYQTIDGDRLTLSFAKAAVKHGAVLANYTEAFGPIRAGQRLAGVKARDHLAGTDLDIRGRVVVNAAGPWAATLLDRAGVRCRWPLLKAMNLITSRPARKAALVAPMREGRALVMLPWRERTLIGTSESADERQPDDQDARRDEVDGFVREINDTFPAFKLDVREITFVHRGIVPAAIDGRRLSLLRHSRMIDHEREGAEPGLISIVGVKYTTARLVAERTVDLLLQKLGRAPGACRTADTPLPGAGLNDADVSDPIVHAIREEMAQTLVDVVVRRTGLGSAGHPGDAVASDVAGRMRAVLGWSEDRTQREIEALRNFYQVV